MNGLIFATDRKYVHFYREKIREACPDTRLIVCCSVPEVKMSLDRKSTAFLLADFNIATPDGPDREGMQFLYDLRNGTEFRYLPLVVITDLEDEKYFAYNRLHCFAYFRKPLNKDLFLQDVIPFLQHSVDGTKWKEQIECLHIIKKRREAYYVPECEMVRFEMHSPKGYIITMDDEIEIDVKNMKGMTGLLSSKRFVQCSRADYVNMDFIRRVGSRTVELQGKFGEVTLSEERRQDVISRLDKRAEEKGRFTL